MRVCVPFYGKIKIHIFILVEKATQVSKKKKNQNITLSSLSKNIYLLELNCGWRVKGKNKISGVSRIAVAQQA